jgi:colicin import membrane protein
MSDRRENSVLFSLKELRRLEDDRVRKEQDDVRSRLEAERAQKEAAERAARDEEERRRREEAERLRLADEDQQAKTREDQMRLQEAERRARVEGEMRIHQERMRLEVQAKARSSPVKAVVTAVVVLLAVGAGLGYKFYTQHQAELAAQQAALDAARADAKKAQAEYEGKMVAIQKEMNDKLANAKDEGERERIRAEAAQARSQAQAAAAVHSRASHASSNRGDKEGTPASKIKAPGKHEISDNPLEGL